MIRQEKQPLFSDPVVRPDPRFFILNWLRADNVIVAARNLEKAEIIADKLGGTSVSISDLKPAPPRAHIIVNTTSASDYHEGEGLVEAISGLNFSNCELVLDLNYGRRQNFWKDIAHHNNVKFLDGLSTLAFQAKRTLALWTGMQVEPEEFLRVLEVSA